MRADQNGNPVAEVVGGPDDGALFFCRDFEDGDTFIPAKTASHRPIYRFVRQPADTIDRFVFERFEE